MNEHTSAHRTHRAFTLTELLVVVAILAVLLVLLMPVASSTTEAVYRVQCAGRMRNIGTAYASLRAKDRELVASQWQYQLATELDGERHTSFTCPKGGMPSALVDWLASQDDGGSDSGDSDYDPLELIDLLYYANYKDYHYNDDDATSAYQINPASQGDLTGMASVWSSMLPTLGGSLDPATGYRATWYLTKEQGEDLLAGKYPALWQYPQALPHNAAWLSTEPIPSGVDEFYVVASAWGMHWRANPATLSASTRRIGGGGGWYARDPSSSPWWDAAYHNEQGSYASCVMRFRKVPVSDGDPPQTQITIMMNPLLNASYSGADGLPAGMTERAYGKLIMAMKADYDIWGNPPDGSWSGNVGRDGMQGSILWQKGEPGNWTDYNWLVGWSNDNATATWTGWINGVHTPGGPFAEATETQEEHLNAEGVSYGINYNITQIAPPGNRPPIPKTILAMDYDLLVMMDPAMNEIYDEHFSMTYIVDPDGNVLEERKRHILAGVHKANVLFVDGSVRMLDASETNPDDHPELWNMP